MSSFNIFLAASGLMLAAAGLAVLRLVLRTAESPRMMPVLYFIGLSFSSVFVASSSRLLEALSFGGVIASPLLRDLMAAYTSLFLFGALWQTYELSSVEKPEWID
nr:MAG: hypothetical protein J07AB56_03630 [Candidatus Nanosalinarum sp. J07AB56]